MKRITLLAVIIFVTAPLEAQMLPRPTAPEPPLITVQGRGEVRVPNTVAMVTLGFAAAGPEEAPIREDVTRRSQAVVAALKAEPKVQQLQTTAVTISPQFAPLSGEAARRQQAPKITGYVAQVTVNYESPVEDAGRLISAMMQAGANSVSNMFTSPSDEARLEAEKQALTLAAKDGEAQARALLAALNLQWSGIRSVDATGGRMEPRPMARAAMMMAPDAPPLPEIDIQGGETVIGRDVLMQVEFGPQ